MLVPPGRKADAVCYVFSNSLPTHFSKLCEKHLKTNHLSRVCKAVAKSGYYLCRVCFPVCLSAWTSPSIRWAVVKISNGSICLSLSTISSFVSNRNNQQEISIKITYIYDKRYHFYHGCQGYQCSYGYLCFHGLSWKPRLLCPFTCHGNVNGDRSVSLYEYF